MEALSRNHCCRGKAFSITYLPVCVRLLARVRACVCGWGGGVMGARARGHVLGACVRVALIIRHVRRMCHIVTSYFASVSNTCFDIISNGRIF